MAAPRTAPMAPECLSLAWHMDGVLQGYLRLYQDHTRQLRSFHTVRRGAPYQNRWTNWHGTHRWLARRPLQDVTTLIGWFNCSAPDQPTNRHQPTLHMATVFEMLLAGRQQVIYEGHGYDYRLRSIRAVVEPDEPEPNQMSQVLATEPDEPEPESPLTEWELCSSHSSSHIISLE